MTSFGHFYLDNEKDIIVDLFMQKEELFYVLKTPNHHTGNLITNLAKLCDLPLTDDENGLKQIEGKIPCYIDAQNRRIYIFRMGNTKVANIFPDGTIEMKASIPSISKTLMSQTKDYRLDISKTIIKTYIPEEYKFRADLHTHMNANLEPDILIALGIAHQIRYPLYYIKKLGLELTDAQKETMEKRRARVVPQFAGSSLTGKYLDRKIDDNTYINFADLILNNPEGAERNIPKIRASLAIMKDGQAVFTNLEKVYLYRYVFTKGKPHEKKVRLFRISRIPDEDIKRYLKKMLADKETEEYKHNTLFQDKLLWIARSYASKGIKYVEISDTTLVKQYEAAGMLQQVHEIMPKAYHETGVMIRFLASIRRIPLTIVKDEVQPETYLKENLTVLRAVAEDPYVAGSDFVGEEINDIQELRPVIEKIVRIAAKDPSFVIRIHAGENDSLKDNVANSIRCVKESLGKRQKMPKMRIGHGLYTANLRTPKGKKLIAELKKYGVVLEFQISSNVRLNNLNRIERHPLKQYLKEGIRCVQGTDGAAIYGTNCIDEQLSLEKLLDLKPEELRYMKETEGKIIREGRQAFFRKMRRFEKISEGKTPEDFLFERMKEETKPEELHLKREKLFDAKKELHERMEPLPWDRHPIVIAGGSFNNDKHTTRVTEEGKEALDLLMKKLNPQEVFFVIGHKLSGYEKYIVTHNDKGFPVFAVVPSMIRKAELDRLRKSGVKITVSTESSGMGIYKSVNYEIFERRPSILIAFDGNSAGANLVQEARNGKGKSTIYVYEGAEMLKAKAQSLEGYVTLFDDPRKIVKKIVASLK